MLSLYIYESSYLQDILLMRDPVYGICGGNYGIHYSTIVWEAGVPELLQPYIIQGT